MKEEELKSFTIHCLKMFLRTVKPWKKRGDPLLPELERYAAGWNDCVKEMKNNGDEYIKKIESL